VFSFFISLAQFAYLQRAEGSGPCSGDNFLMGLDTLFRVVKLRPDNLMISTGLIFLRKKKHLLCPL